MAKLDPANFCVGLSLCVAAAAAAMWAYSFCSWLQCGPTSLAAGCSLVLQRVQCGPTVVRAGCSVGTATASGYSVGTATASGCSVGLQL